MRSSKLKLARVGVFGGTFDPVHVGHLVTAVNVRFALGLDTVLLVVANQPWQKADREVSPAEYRIALVRAAVAAIDGVEASEIELIRGGISYTADTLTELRRRHPESELFLVVGSDLVDELENWERSEELSSMATLVVAHRPGFELPASVPGWTMVGVEVPGFDISSTEIRQRIADGRPLDFLLPPQAATLARELRMFSSYADSTVAAVQTRKSDVHEG